MDAYFCDTLAITFTTVRSIFLMALGFSLVIFIHELGHFLAAKMVGIRAEEFAIGFGRRLFGIKYGETDYRINILPLGGYVKMTGQEDSTLYTEENMATDDPRSFNAKPIWARMLVVSAGVIMNIILAAILFVIIFSTGRDYFPSIVGGLAEGYPAENAEISGVETPGLMPGDEILAINDKEIYDFSKLQITAILSSDTDTHTFKIRRPGVDKILYAKVGLAPSITDTGNIGRKFGIYPTGTNNVAVSLRQFKQDDTIVAINGQSVSHGWQIGDIITSQEFGSELVFDVKRLDENGNEQKLSIEANITPTWSSSRIRHDVSEAIKKKATPPYYTEGFNVSGLLPRAVVNGVEPGSPAENAGLKDGDIISVFGPDMEAVSIEKLQGLCKQYIRQNVDIRILRDGKLVSDINKIEVASYKKTARIGIGVRIDKDSLTLGEVKNSSPFTGKISGGDTITAVNGKAVSTWIELISALGELSPSETCQLSYTTPSGAAKTTDAVNVGTLGFKFDDYCTTMLNAGIFKPMVRQRKSANPAEAVKWGTEATVDFIINTYATLSAFFTGNVSGKEFSGPIGIFSMGVASGAKSDKNLLWLLAIISANLAVINFLPLPIVDGGLAVMLLIEKLRGKPLSVKVQNIIQVAGLIMIVAVFILLTYNDLARLISNRW